jgi:hypothetical protein
VFLKFFGDPLDLRLGPDFVIPAKTLDDQLRCYKAPPACAGMTKQARAARQAIKRPPNPQQNTNKTH